MPDIAQPVSNALSQAFERARGLTDNGQARKAAVGDVLEMVVDVTQDLQRLHGELLALRNSVLGSRPGVGAWFTAERFDEIGEQLLASTEQCLELVDVARRALAIAPPRIWQGLRRWRRGKEAARKLDDFHRGFEMLNAAARKWPKSDATRVAEARKSIEAGHSVEVKDILRELHASS